MESVWTKSIKRENIKSPIGNVKTEVLIIGGGLAGILCAYFLHHENIPYLLVESKTLLSGITKNTTAKITSQHGLIYAKLIKRFGEEKAKQYLLANEAAIIEYRNLCKSIDCSFEEKNSYVYSIDDINPIEQELDALNKLNFKAKFEKEICIPIKIAGAIKFENQAQFNPLQFAFSICSELNLSENTTVRELIGSKAITNHGIIEADKIIVTTHFPFINKHGAYYLKLYQHRSYVIAYENVPDINGMYVDEASNGLSFRNYENLLLIGGGGHRTGKNGGCYQQIRGFARTNYPNAKENLHWATQDCISLDDVPYIGNYSSGTNNLYVATGFNKWGMTSSMIAAKILCDELCGRKNEYREVFSPERSILRPRLFENTWEATINLLTPTKRRCPHLGCALKWNSIERTWDCPCHGSRFTESGNLIDNPATKNKSFKP